MIRLSFKAIVGFTFVGVSISSIMMFIMALTIQPEWYIILSLYFLIVYSVNYPLMWFAEHQLK